MKKPIKKQSISSIYTVSKPYSKTNFILVLEDIFVSKRRLFANWNERWFFTDYPIVAKLIFSLQYENKFIVYIDSTWKVFTKILLEKGSHLYDVRIWESRIFTLKDIRNFANHNDYYLNNILELKSEDYVVNIDDNLDFDNLSLNFWDLENNNSQMPKNKILESMNENLWYKHDI